MIHQDSWWRVFFQERLWGIFERKVFALEGGSFLFSPNILLCLPSSGFFCCLWLQYLLTQLPLCFLVANFSVPWVNFMAGWTTKKTHGRNRHGIPEQSSTCKREKRKLRTRKIWVLFFNFFFTIVFFFEFFASPLGLPPPPPGCNRRSPGWSGNLD